MRSTLARQIAFLLFLTAGGALLTLGIVYRYLSQTATEGAFLNLAGRQRMLSEQLSAYAHMVQMEQQEADRAPLERLADDFDQVLQALKQGGRVRERDLPPAPAELEEEFAAVDELWQQLRPALLSVARQPAGNPEAAAAYARVRTGSPLLTGAADQVVGAYEAWSRGLRQRLLGVLAGIAAFDLFLFFFGLWTVRRYVAERHRTEQELRQLSSVVEQTADLVMVTDREGRIEYMNPAFEQLTGYSRGEVVGHTPRLLKSGRHSREFYAAMWETLLSGQVYRGELVDRRKDGTLFRTAKVITPLRDARGEIARFVSTDRDITAHKEAEEALRQSEERHRLLAEQVTDMITRCALDGTYLYVSPACRALLGYEPEELVGSSVHRLIHPQDAQEVARCHEEVLAQPAPCAASIRFRRRDGRFLWSEAVARSVRDPETGAAQEIVAVVRDISERRRRELQELVLHQVREEIWRMQSPDDIQQLLVAVGRGLERLEIDFRACGINIVDPSREPPRTQTFSIDRKNGGWRIIPENYEQASEAIVQFWRGKEPRYRRDLEAEDSYQERAGIAGIFGPVRSVVDIPFPHGTLAVNSDQPDAFSGEQIAFMQALAGVLSEGFRRLDDLQVLAAKEEQLRQAQKMESLGLLAGGVAHDFNNLLTIIKGYGQILAKSAALGPAERASLGEIDWAAERAAGLVRQLLAFSRQQVTQPQVLDLNQIIEGVIKMLGRLLGENIELVTGLDPQIGRVKADPGQLEQVLVNLAVNARDAMPEGGKLTIETAAVELDVDQHLELLCSCGKMEPGAYVRLRVSDTGIGMDAATRSRIFEPFFTTKEMGRGTGLGLSVVYGIVVRANSGHIGVYSQPGEGTTFQIYLPRVEEENSTVRPDSASPASARGTETVLLAEDDETIRRLMERLLAEQGYTVLAAGSGEEALKLVAARCGEIGLLITDLGLPGMRGEELARQLAAQGHAAKVLYISGHLGNSLGDQVRLDSATNFLQKPFSLDDLVYRVRQLLDAPAQA
ncbi:MAG: PAS domain S-box protein [Candidatus Latescibacterota bacterium]